MLRPRRRALTVTAILIAALALRIAEVQRTAYRPAGDAVSYLRLADQVAGTGDYDTRIGTGGTRGPTAYFPPGYPYFLAGVRLIDASVDAARLSQAVLGTLTVALIGLTTLEAFGGAVALIALSVAAVYPVLVELSGVLAAENLLTVLVLAAVWAALRARRSPHPIAWLAAAGVLTGLATLTHLNAIVLFLPLGVAAWTAARGAGVAIVALGTAVAIAPWSIRNAVELHRVVPVADETGVTLAGTYNSASAHNHRIAYAWRFYSTIPEDRVLLRRAATITETRLDAKLRDQALDYIADHPSAPIEVAAHNTLRLLELDGTFARRASAASIGLPDKVADVGVAAFWLLCGAALAGAFTPRARRGPRWIWLAPALLALTVVLINAETPRFREPLDPFLILLAACAIATAAPAAGKRLRRAPVAGEARSAVSRRDAQLIEMVERLP